METDRSGSQDSLQKEESDQSIVNPENPPMIRFESPKSTHIKYGYEISVFKWSPSERKTEVK